MNEKEIQLCSVVTEMDFTIVKNVVWLKKISG